MQKSRNVNFDESKFYFEKKMESDEGERVVSKSAKEVLVDPDWQEAMKKRLIH